MGLPIVDFSPPHDGPRRAGHQGGFTYLAAIIAIAILGLHLAAAGTLWHAAAQRERESQLRFVGNEFRNAIRSYYEGATGTVKIYPVTLEDLLLDKRYLGVKRHLRRIYRDPLTGRADWELIRALDGGIMSIRSKARPSPQGGS